MRALNENKLCCLIDNIKIVGEEDTWPCNCTFRYCNGCFDVWVHESSRFFPEYNALVDAHFDFDPACKYNEFLQLRLEAKKKAAERWSKTYEPQAKNETSQEGSEDSQIMG